MTVIRRAPQRLQPAKKKKKKKKRYKVKHSKAWQQNHTYSLSVNAVHSKQQGSKTRPLGTFPQGPLGKAEEEERGGTMHQYVDQVVGVRPELGEVVVEVAVGEHRKWAVRLVAFHPRHRAAPKIVLEEIPHSSLLWIQVIVGEDASVVVKNEPALQRVDVNGKCHCENYRSVKPHVARDNKRRRSCPATLMGAV